MHRFLWLFMFALGRQMLSLSVIDSRLYFISYLTVVQNTNKALNVFSLSSQLLLITPWILFVVHITVNISNGIEWGSLALES